MPVVKERELVYDQTAPCRRSSSAAHRSILPDNFLEQRIKGSEQAKRRLEEIRNLFNLERSRELVPRERASLEIELIWLEFRADKITSEERQSCLQEKLNVWEREEPDLFNWLVGENGDGLNPLSRIRNRVVPPFKRKRSRASRR